MTQVQCKICGKLFDRVGNGVYCNGPHYRPCPVCGTPVAYQRPSDPYNCCSKECTDKRADESKKNKNVKICIECGREFHPRQSNQVYCNNPHTSKCVICNKEFQYTCRPSEKPNTCSKNCQEKLRSLTTMKRYGVSNVSELDEVRQKISERNRSEEVKEKRRQTSLKNWGVDNPAKSDEVKQRQVDTFLDHYGTTNPMKDANVAAKLGDILADPAHVEDVKQTLMERYGVDNVNDIPGVRDKMIATTLKNHGVPYYVMSKDYQEGPGHVISQLNKKIQTIFRRNGIESELEFTLGNRSYDLHLPALNTFVEINPTYTHNAVGNHWGKGLSKNYHRDKTRLATENGYRCINVWDWDSVDKIVQMLLPKVPVYARKCRLNEIDNKTAELFENMYHLQGKVKGQTVCLGLYYAGELVQVVTFGKPRYNRKYEWELLRLCSNSKFAVVGGAEKMWNYFINTYSPKSIISYCDMSKFTGHVYESLSMSLDHIVEPNKIWSKGVEMITNNLLLQRGYDQIFNAKYGKGTDNEELMIANGWLPVYDCGQAVYIYLNSNKLPQATT